MNLLPKTAINTLCSCFKKISLKLFNLLIAIRFKEFGTHSVIESPIRLLGAQDIAIGSRTYIGSDSWLCTLFIRNESFHRSVEPILKIGNNVSISGHCTISAVERVTIEDNVLIARYAYIADHTHAYSDPSIPIKDQGVTKISPVLIKNGAWLGQNVIICPGVTIGKNSVVAANSIVRQDVPDFTVVAGSPAKAIKSTKS